MNRDDFELASSGYRVQNDRPERPESLAEGLRGGTRLAAPDRPAVQLGDGDDLGGRTGEEHLVRRVQVVAVQRKLFDGVGCLTRKLDHGIARHAAQNPGVGGWRL